MRPAAYQGYKFVDVELRPSGVCVGTFTSDHPSGTQVLTGRLFKDLDRFMRQAAEDEAVRVVVLRSSHPEFWICHFDVELLLRVPTDSPIERPDLKGTVSGMCEVVHTMGKPTIAEVAGRVGGGGAEIASAFDMRFGVEGRTFVAQAEAGLGLLAGAGGTTRWPYIAGRGRALEVLLGCVDLDAAAAERWGWLNRAFATAEGCSAYVEWLAERMAQLPPEALRLTKASVVNSLSRPFEREEVLRDEMLAFNKLLRRPEAQALMKRFVERGGQTKEVERRPDALLAAKL